MVRDDVDGNDKISQLPCRNHGSFDDVYWPPDPNGGAGSFLNMDTGTGAATNVSVQLKPSGSTDPIRNNEVIDIPIETGAALIPLSARLYTKSGGVTPGRVSSVINVAFSYK